MKESMTKNQTFVGNQMNKFVILLPIFLLSMCSDAPVTPPAGAFEVEEGLIWKALEYANEYNPLISDFHIQNQKKIGSFPLFDFFFNAKIRQTKIFIIAVTIANTKKAAVKLLLNGGGGEI